MKHWQSYREYFLAALLLHVLFAIGLLWEHTSTSVAIKSDSGHAPVEELAVSLPPEIHSIQAHSVDATAVNAAVEQLKLAREEAVAAEQKHQQQLVLAARALEQKRLQEQRHLEALKAEAAQLAFREKKRIEQQQHRLAELAKQKELEKQQLQALKAEKQERIREAEKAKLAAAMKVKRDAIKAAEAAASKARMAGVIDQYKARIIHAISQEWILPERVDSRLSSQFRIRLSPDGRVLEVSLIRSSGDPVLDRSAQSAIYKASPLPVPQDAELFKVFRDISLTVRPENIQG